MVELVAHEQSPFDSSRYQLRRQQESGVHVGPVDEAGRVTGSGREPEPEDAVGLPQSPTEEESEDLHGHRSRVC